MSTAEKDLLPITLNPPASETAKGRGLRNGNGHDKALNRPTREQAEEAVRTLIAWAGDDPSREGRLETPGRVVDSYEEFFAGYKGDPYEILTRTFGDVHGYDDLVMLRDIRLE
jgi:GTP cyclohydrolase I